MAMVAYLFTGACLDYHRISQYDDWWSKSFSSVRRTWKIRVRGALEAPRVARLLNELSAETDTHEALRIQVDPALWDEISTDVDEHWGQWIEAELERAGDLHEVELRFRGDASAHWTGPKKSLSIKTKSDDLYKGYRRLNFTVKGVLPQHLAASFAEDFRLLCPTSEVVPIFVNNQFFGLHRFVERPDESFLRRNRLMPGNVFRGDAGLRGTFFKGLPRELFANPYIWDRVAVNDRPGATGDRALFEFVADLNTSSFEEHLVFMSWFDRQELARMIALMLVMGDPHHMSGINNQLWYEDPSSGKLHPIVWDLLLLRLGFPLPDRDIHRFWLAALRDPRLFDETLAVLSEWVRDDRLLTLARQRIDEVAEEFPAHIEFEGLRQGTIVPLGNMIRYAIILRLNMEAVGDMLREAEISARDTALADGSRVLDLLTRGRAGAELRGMVVEADGAREVRVRADRDLGGEADSGDRALAATAAPLEGGLRLVFDRPEGLIPGCTGSGVDFVAEPLHYRFFVSAYDGSGNPVTVRSVQPELYARHADERLTPSELGAGEAIPSTLSWHPWQYVDPPMNDVRLTGEVRLTDDLVIEIGSTLTIEPGTTLLLDPDVSVLARGRVVARGEEARPIAIRASDPRAPWGVFALQGRGASGSRFEHVSFTGGGGALLERVEYKGSVCVHNAHDVVFERCSFAANMRCDDLFNAVRAGVDLLGCTFDEANADSIDYDMSTGEIRHCRITGSGNDGIDLMTCSPRIVSTLIADSGDKGISVGEDATPLVFDCQITGCAVGMEVKDMSTPVILNTTISGNQVGLLQRHKNWRYPSAGRAKLVDSLLDGNDVDYRGSGGAQLTRADGAPWMRSLFGYAVDGSAPGRARSAATVTPARVVARWSPPNRFLDPNDGWRPLGRVRQLLVRDRDLVASFRTGAGAVGTFVDWDLTGDEDRYVLVLEAASDGLEDGRVALAAGRGELTGELVLGADPASSHYTTVDLAPGRYTAMTLAASAPGQTGELRLHGWTVLALPPEVD